jgi:hypothetical protein
MNTLEKIVPAPGITVYTDENGVTREYREVKRRAKVGELIKVNVSDGITRVVDRICRVVENEPGFDWWSEYGVETDSQWDDGSTLNPQHSEYVVLEPTDIIHYNGKRYREVQRVAKEGEFVIITGDHVSHGYPIGSIHLVHRADEDGVWDAGTEHMALCDNDGEWDYLVLEPFDTDTQPSQPQSDIESRLAALEQRVAELERKLQIRDIANKVMERNDAAFQKLARAEFQEYLRASEAVSDEAELTRERVIELAKRDVEELLSKNYPGKGYDGHGIWLSEEDGSTITDAVRFVVNRSKRTVVALVHTVDFPGDIRARGKAKCAPGDCFNIHIGKAIALRRALGLDVPDYYVNAPQPTEAQVGDVVKSRKYSGVYSVSERFVDDPKRLCLEYVQTEMRTCGDLYIIDDSHDFGGDAV